MSLLSSATVLRLVDSMAILLSQAYQLARARLASGPSSINCWWFRQHAWTHARTGSGIGK